jgi:LPXTG-site transpeptidase (sortase) family protein
MDSFSLTRFVNKFFAALVAVMIALAALPVTPVYAATTINIALGAQSGTLTYGTAGSVTFSVSVTCSGSGSAQNNIPLSITTTLPSGATSGFSTTTLTGWGTNCSGTTPQTSTLTINTTNLTPAGATTITVQAAGNNTVTASRTLTIGERGTTTTITSDTPDPSTVGQAVAVNFTVAASGGTGATPTGNVTVSDGVNSCTGTVAAGTCSITLNTAGARTLTASYEGVIDTNYLPSTSAGVSHTVNNLTTTTTTITTDSPDASVTGETVNVAVTVTGGTTPTGTVDITGADSNCTVTLSSGGGNCNVTFTSPGAKTLTATYNGDGSHSTSSDTEAHTVNKANTTTSITSDTPNPSVVGQSVTVNYSVSVTAPGAGTPTGNVTVSDGTNSCTGTVAAGTCSITFTSYGSKNLTVTYAGDTSFNGSTSTSASHTVNKADTTTSITSDTPDPSVVGQSVTVNYSVAVTTPGAGTPTGNVTVSDGTSSCTGTVAAGTCSITFTSSGSKNLTATYAGDTNFNGSASTSVSHTVNKADTTTSITSDTPDPSVVGQSVTVNYSVSVTAPGSGTPTGNVTVSDGTSSCTGTVAAGTCSITFTSSGSKNLTATYVGDANFNGSTSASAAHTVNHAGTTTTITSDTPDPSVVGQSVVINYSVSVTAPGAGTPTGNVTVSDGTNSCTGTVAAGTCSIPFTNPGTTSLTATYAGDANFNGSTSASDSHTVNKADTTTSITSDTPDPSVQGQSVTVNYSVSVTVPGSGTPTGNVTVSDGVDSCTGTVAAGTCSITFTGSGSKNLAATFVGDTNFNGSTSPSAGHTVDKASTTTSITGNTPDPSVVGQSVVFNYSVAVTAPGSGTPTGNVTVSDGTSSCTSIVAAGTCSITFTNPGSKSLTATYTGDTDFDGSTSTSTSQTVNKASTTTSITSDTPDPSVVGESVTVNYSVTVTSPGSGTPTGNVTVSDGVNNCTGTVAAGTCSITFTSPGSKSLSATYAGDTNFNGSTSTSAGHTVNNADTATTITSDTPDPSAGGQSITVNYAVSVTAPGSGTPTGNVSVSDGVDSCTGTVGAGGCNITLTTNGIRTITATYAGDSNFNTSTSTGESHTVDATAPTVSSINRADGDPTNAASVNFTVTFSESVNGGSASNFSLFTSGAISGASISGVSGSGATRTVAVNTGTGDGTIRLDLSSNTGITDVIGNSLGTATFTSGQFYTIIKSGPTVTVGAPNFTATNAGPVDFPITVTGATSVNLLAANVTLNTTGSANGSILITNGATNTPTVTINSITGDGTLGISIAAGVASDATANTSPSAGPSSTFIVDNTSPQVASNGINTNVDTGDGVLAEFEVAAVGINQFTVTFNEDVSSSSANNVNNYMLLNDNGNGFEDTPATITCKNFPSSTHPNGGNDFKLTINSAVYSNSGGSGPFAATLSVNGGNPLSNGHYRLYACGTTSITDSAGNELNRNGQTGTDFIRNFTVQLSNGGNGGNGGGGGGGITSTSGFIPVTSGFIIPVTGFSPSQITNLPVQPANKAYLPIDDLRLEIPSLGINIPIIGVKLQDNGWDVKWLENNAGYLEGSAYPTWKGNTVLTGHVTDANGKPGPFAYINELKAGDTFYIHNNGLTYTYQVQESKLILPISISALLKHEDYDWVTLVTCEKYDATLGRFIYRRMVRAALVSVSPEK